MPFVELECTPDVLSSLNLPESLDERHPYHYHILRHDGREALLISQSHNHNHETFETEILVVGGHKVLVEKILDCKRIKDTWRYTLRAIRLYADLSDQPALRDSLANYLHDILAAFRRRNRYIRMSAKVVLEVCESNSRSRGAVGGFRWCTS